MKITDAKVLFVSDVYPSSNGVGSYYLDIVELLNNNFVKSVLLHPTPFSRKLNVRQNWLTFIDLPGDKNQRLFIPNPSQVNSFINEFKPDLIVLTTPGLFSYIALRYGIRRDCYFCYAIHTDFPSLTKLYWREPLATFISKIMFLIDKFFSSKCSEIVAPSLNISNTLSQRFNRSVTRVGTTLPQCFLNSFINDSTLSVNKIVFVGRLAPEKDIPSILSLCDVNPTKIFYIVGEGPLSTLVKEKSNSSSNLVYVGKLSRMDLCKFLDSIDLLLLPSLVESYGTVALEAMIRQKLVIVSASSGIASSLPFL